MPSAFFAYDSRPEVTRETLHRTSVALTATGMIDVTSWESLRVDGRIIVSEIIRAIDGSDLCIADLSTLNSNVLFEVGYAIGRGRKVWLLVEKGDDQARTLLSSFRLLDSVGYFAWENSESIRARFLEVTPHIGGDEGLWADLVAGADAQDPSGIFFMPSLHDADPNRVLARILEARRKSGYNVVAADPTESRLEPLDWYAEQIYRSSAVVVHLESQRRSRHQIHNARSAFVAGMAAGSGRPLLMLAEEAFESPFDYQDLLRRYRNASDCGAIAENWFSAAAVRPRSHLDTGRRRLAVELRSLRLGEHVAENEVHALPTYFIETAAYRDLVTGGGVTVFVGRKGTGKTANMYLAAADLNANPSNLVVTIKPASYDFAALAELMHNLQGSLQDHAIDAIWKFLIISEIARSVLEELHSRPAYLPQSQADRRFVEFVDAAPFDLTEDVASRIELAVRRVSSVGVSGKGGMDERAQLSEALHQEWIGRLREQLHQMLKDRERVAVLVDNLDKGWERRSDLSALSRLLLGLLSSVGRVERELRRGDRERRDPLDVSLALFLRSDIFSYLTAGEAREPDKLNVRKVEWSDPEVLTSVIEQRFLASRPDGAEVSELWERFFPSTVRGMPTRRYMLSRVLPRPRDLIYFANACIRIAIDRSHERIEEADVLSAEKLYSQFAFEALLVENGITIDEFESVLFEFATGPAQLQEAEAVEIVRRAGPSGMQVEQVLRRLKQVGFLGMVVGRGRVEYPESGREAERAEVLARKYVSGRPGAEQVVVHPAFRAYLEIDEPPSESSARLT